MQVSLVGPLIKGLNQHVSIARVTVSQCFLSQPHIIVMVKVWEPNTVPVMGAPTVAGAAPGTLSPNEVQDPEVLGPSGRQVILISEAWGSGGRSVRLQPFGIDTAVGLRVFVL
jgi:hypothetical protein